VRVRGGRVSGMPYLGNGRRCRDVALAVWPRRMASTTRGMGTREGIGTAPELQREGGVVRGETARAGVGCWLGEGRLNARPLGVRSLVSSQSTGE
jgi:hypothetical protein